MRSGVLIGAAIAVLTARLLAGHGEHGAAAAPAAASAATALLAGAAASAPVVAPVPVVAAAPAPAHAPGMVAATDAPPALPGQPAPGAVAAFSGRAASASLAMRAASVEAEVRAQRARGDGEEAIYRTRAVHLPAEQVAQLMARETAEAAWQRQLAGCGGNCEAASPEPMVASAYRQHASPRLTQE